MGKNVNRDPRTSPAVPISYPCLFKPGEKYDTFSITLMIDKKNPEAMAYMKSLYGDAKSALEEHFPDAATRPRHPIAGHDKSPIKDGDKNNNNKGIPLRESNPEYAGHWIIRATRQSSQGPPLVVDPNNQEVMSQRKIYGGCVCKVNMNAYTFESEKNSGVTFGLNGVKFVEDGEPLGSSRQSVEEMFGGASAGSGGGSDDDPFGEGSTPPGEGASDDPFADGGPF